MDHDVLLAFGGSAAFDGVHDRLAPPPTSGLLPGPWRFVTSGYAIVLLAMAILLNRIQNIVVPPRHSIAARLSRSLRRQSPSRLRRIYDSILPLDLSSTYCRLALRLPSLYFLSKALVLWTVILIQTSELFPAWTWTSGLGKWAADMEMEGVCWSSFCAVCFALCTSALTRGLEGIGASANSSPFNLFGYAFSLHIYSWPSTHVAEMPGMSSRPDKHIIFTLIMPLLQLTMIHFLGIKQRWAQQRLIPTTIVSSLALLHFFVVLWTSPTSYPLLNYLPCIFESGLLCITLLALGLNVLTQILLEGTVTRPLFGHQETLMPKWDEDFSIVLLRMGTASLEATSVAGFGNEVGLVSVPDLDASKAHNEYGSLEMNRLGVAAITNAVEWTGRRRRMKEGFANEIRHVRAKGSSNDGDLWIDSAWPRELTRFATSLKSFLVGLWRFAWDRIRGRTRQRMLTNAPNQEDTALSRETTPAADDAAIPDAYDRFLRGEVVSDDEDEYEPRQRSRAASVSDSSSSSSDSEEEQDNVAETVGLYADLSSASASASTSAPVMLAHMTDTSKSPLTRRRFSRLIGGGGGNSSAVETAFNDWSRVLDGARSLSMHERDREESRRSCVICTVEPRQIICWPCRCLAMCDDCRENMATRSSSHNHSCPCCRRVVEGYSKIFIP
ncbi:hypothetical protein FIBSPDRAFT_760914 [Athelia psychrophila]|uniref:RING-type domain-containing protein n=1 Tax=Athelia psychrophila TaxID=1759441 RepID=A0A165XMW4_9AGAM|nr:hypothetical protein FIBSPDRAFT_760914 [Fibularhizoctonia sp. CBS 109695]